ncbi:uncharacterized protein LOC123552241 [Mercenaria mercenaria]|uniref:uncharacterized protein LOC123552241 n=1 Tax=Mercenaria mercenaria TaxID=6596 RepID=UPI00234FA1ED|nr:uncharacterized protein LOC123552241 [Mercenaria mercenaria]
MKLSLKKSGLYTLIKDLSPTSSGSSKGIVSNGITKYGHLDKLPNPCKVVGFMFATIGALVTLRWTVSFLVSLHGTTIAHYSPPEPWNEHDTSQDSSEPITDCPRSYVYDELSDRLQLLEMAFKEQVFARETIAREINDQSDIYGSLDRKLALFLEKLDNVTHEYANLESKYKELSARVNSDETLGAIILLILMLQMFCTFRPRILELLGPVTDFRPALNKLIQRPKIERKTSSNQGTPKHMVGLRNEVCVICFQRDSADSLILKLTEAMFRHLEGLKVTMKPFYAIFSMEDLRNIPHVKLYVILVDLESRGLYINGCEKDLVFTTVKYTKSIGAHTVVVITNDEGSKNLTAHSIYNSTLRMVKTNDNLQDLAANGRLFSMWQEMTSHQLSHLRRMVKTVLNAKLIMR